MVHLVYGDLQERNATVKSVQNYVKLSDEEIEKILSENQNKLNLS